jgi:hypothetical protein
MGLSGPKNPEPAQGFLGQNGREAVLAKTTARSEQTRMFESGGQVLDGPKNPLLAGFFIRGLVPQNQGNDGQLADPICVMK